MFRKTDELLKTPENQRTEALYLAAINEDWKNLLYVPEEKRTPAICLAGMRRAALEGDCSILEDNKYIPQDKFTQEMHDLCLGFVKINGKILESIPESIRTPCLCLAAIQNNWEALQYISPDMCSVDMCLAGLRIAAKSNMWWILADNTYIPQDKFTDEMSDLCIELVRQNWRILESIPENNRTAALCLAAIECNAGALKFVPEKMRTAELCIMAIEQDWRALEFVPEGICDEEVNKKHIEILKTTIPLQESDEKFLLSRSCKDKWFITQLIHQSSVLGKITIKGALLTCSQIASRKSDLKRLEQDRYDFNPVIIEDTWEFGKYLEVLKHVALPCRSRFIKTGGGHWIAGDIYINSAGELSMLYMESLGFDMETADYDPWFEAVKMKFKNVTIYVSELKRQNDYTSCMVFALDDVRHLYTVDHYLASENKNENLHDYLAAKDGRDLYLMSNLPDNLNIYKSCFLLVNQQLYYIKSDGTRVDIDIPDFTKFTNDLAALNKDNAQKIFLLTGQIASLMTFKPEDIRVTKCDLPLTFLRTMQSSALFGENPDDIIMMRSIDEQKKPINKKRHVLTPQFARDTFFAKKDVSVLKCNRIVMLDEKEDTSVEFVDKETLYLKKEDNKIRAYWYDLNKNQFTPHNIVNRKKLLHLINHKQVITHTDAVFNQIAYLCSYPSMENMRIQRQLQKMNMANWEYIKTHDIQTIQSSMTHFTLEEFIKVNAKPAVSHVRPK